MLSEMRTTDAVTFMGLTAYAVSEKLLESAESYIQANIVELGKRQASRSEVEHKHLVVYAVDEVRKIVGYRYFFFKPSHPLCRMFATFVDANHRRKGIATRLIEESFDIAVSHGCSEFEIRLTRPSPEKDALFSWYFGYAKTNSHQLKFIIYYWNKLVRYGYA
jgi:GNAT superfamily N-acetyltransferase